ncbi:unnamed protein product [Victoria cruziana]
MISRTACLLHFAFSVVRWLEIL